MKKNTISVIIPTHNRPALLKRAIESVLGQTVPADEIVVVDDASCTETKKLVESFGSPNLYYIENVGGRGASSSRNLGVEKASGDYVAFLDDDDVWLPKKIEKQIELISQKNFDAVFSRILIQYENTNISYSTGAKMHRDALSIICMENFIGATISSVIKRGVFISLGGFDISFPAREEYDLWIRLIASGANISIIEEPLCISYRSLEKRNRISASISNYEIAIDKLNVKHQKLISETLSLSKIKYRTSKQYEFLAAQGISIGLRVSPFLYYIKSFLNKPAIKPIILAPCALLSPTLLIKFRSKMSA